MDIEHEESDMAHGEPPETSRSSTTRIGPGGRIVIPAHMRRELGLSVGDTVHLRTHDGELRIVDPAEALRRVKARFQSLVSSEGPSMVDELIAERRTEAQRDEARGSGGPQ